MKKFMVLKLVGLAALTMITLVIISVLEVVIYSYVVNPGQPVSVYEKHAEFSAPYISGIFGFIVFFVVARYWKARQYENLSQLVLIFPLVYVILDLAIVTLGATVSWSEYFLIFILANGAKFAGCYLGYRLPAKSGNLARQAGESPVNTK